MFPKPCVYALSDVHFVFLHMEQPINYDDHLYAYAAGDHVACQIDDSYDGDDDHHIADHAGDDSCMNPKQYITGQYKLCTTCALLCYYTSLVNYIASFQFSKILKYCLSKSSLLNTS